MINQGLAMRVLQLRKITAAQAMDALREAMQEDYGYAWSWHCNVAMAAQDAGAPHKDANERAAQFMRNAFGVDTSRPLTHEFSRAGRRRLE